MIYVFLANGFEEAEALCPVDLLRRSGSKVLTVGVDGTCIAGSHHISVQADITENEMRLDDDLEMIVLPGGMPGTLNLEASETVQKAVAYCVQEDRYIAAICAAPSILGHKGLLNGKEAIAYPGFEKDLLGAKISEHSVCKSGNIITAQGAGAAIPFGLKLVETLHGTDAAQKLAAGICYPEH